MTRAGWINAGGMRYRVIVWVDPRADAPRHAALDGIVRSIAFAPLQTGARLPNGAVVIGPATDYPLGSFTRVEAGGRPFVLVHAPGGFYALGSVSSRPAVYRDRCSLSVEADRGEIQCATCEARWDRVGRVIVRPAGAERDDPLHLAATKVAWDGHVLLHPGSSQHADDTVAHRFWPPSTS